MGSSESILTEKNVPHSSPVKSTGSFGCTSSEGDFLVFMTCLRIIMKTYKTVTGNQKVPSKTQQRNSKMSKSNNEVIGVLPSSGKQQGDDEGEVEGGCYCGGERSRQYFWSNKCVCFHNDTTLYVYRLLWRNTAIGNSNNDCLRRMLASRHSNLCFKMIKAQLVQYNTKCPLLLLIVNQLTVPTVGRLWRLSPSWTCCWQHTWHQEIQLLDVKE